METHHKIIDLYVIFSNFCWHTAKYANTTLPKGKWKLNNISLERCLSFNLIFLFFEIEKKFMLLFVEVNVNPIWNSKNKTHLQGQTAKVMKAWKLFSESSTKKQINVQKTRSKIFILQRNQQQSTICYCNAISNCKKF